MLPSTRKSRNYSVPSVFKQRNELWTPLYVIFSNILLLSEVRNASIIALMLEAVRTSETSVYFSETTRRHKL
jgi:hypothetical protein